jgi:hypothetical protein
MPSRRVSRVLCVSEPRGEDRLEGDAPVSDHLRESDRRYAVVDLQTREVEHEELAPAQARG